MKTTLLTKYLPFRKLYLINLNTTWRENRRDARQESNNFENYRVAHRARVRLRADMFW